MYRSIVPAAWDTERLAVRDVTVGDAAEIHEIALSCRHVEPWDPTFAPSGREEADGLVARSLGPDEASGIRFRLQTIRLREGSMIGYYHCIHGGPEPEDVWISMMMIRPEHRGRRYGDEIVSELAGHLREAGYRWMKLDVYLKNWPALRFWTRAGFTTIIGVLGDAQHDAVSHAKLRLRKSLD